MPFSRFLLNPFEHFEETFIIFLREKYPDLEFRIRIFFKQQYFEAL